MRDLKDKGIQNIPETIKVTDYVKVKEGTLVKKRGRPSPDKSRSMGKTTGTQKRVAGPQRVTYSDHQKMR